MALFSGCFQIDGLARLAAAVLVSASTLCLASASAEARHARHYRHYAHAVPWGRMVRYTHGDIRVAHAPRHMRYAYRAHARYARGAPAAVGASPAFSALVVDANSGRTLYSLDENGLRHPASITKVMTLYLLFEQLDRGAMTLRTQIPISEHAAAQEPSKLGLRPGDTISVEDAIKAVVTRSANDIAVAIAEAVGGSESSFAELMTRKAHELGMASTVYVNTSRLPNDQQITTAHDLTILALAQSASPRYRGGDRRGCRRLGKQFRRADDAQGARARHGQHGLRQRLRAPQRPADHHGARPDAPRALARRALSSVLPLFLDRPIRFRRRDHRQPQSSARPGRRRRWNQDRLHPGVGSIS